MKIGETLVRWLYPDQCALCGRIITEEGKEGLCAYCDPELFRIPWKENPGKERTRASFRYEGRLRSAISALKYKGRKSFGAIFAAWMLEDEKAADYIRGFDLLTSVPVSKKRLKNRGYNQAELIARSLSERTGVPYEELLVRVRNTKALKGMDKTERIKALQAAFAPAEGVKDRLSGHMGEKGPLRVLLIDDICTTGSTLEECAGVLEEAFPGILVRGLAFASENEDYA